MTVLAALGAAAWLAASPALAAIPTGPLPEGGVTRKEVADWLIAKGYTAEVKDDGSGNMVVSSKIKGVSYDIYFLSCEEERCGSIQYAAGWSDAEDVTLDKLNTWTTTKRYLRVYKNKGGSVWAEYDIDIAPGGSWEQMGQGLKRFKQIIEDFQEYMDW